MDSDTWAKTMNNARQHAVVRHRRARVSAVKMTDRSARLFGTRWLYVIEAD